MGKKRGFVGRAIQEAFTTAALYGAVAGSASTSFQNRNHDTVKNKADSISYSARAERGNTARKGTSDTSNRKRGNHKKR